MHIILLYSAYVLVNLLVLCNRADYLSIGVLFLSISICVGLFAMSRVDHVCITRFGRPMRTRIATNRRGLELRQIVALLSAEEASASDEAFVSGQGLRQAFVKMRTRCYRQALARWSSDDVDIRPECPRAGYLVKHSR